MPDQTTSLVAFVDPQPPRFHHTDIDGDRLLITTADIPSQGRGVHFRTDEPGSSVPLDKIPELLSALQEIATCPACEAPPLEWCAACGRCRCDRHDECTRPLAEIGVTP
ncbi:hypothetical protein [Streptomyces sulphureus]|uniref:hypothetical protein n=1 Tax=Streptomyces sulphureus TaxID=47758 RepID=UPI0003748E82|nr:hypothetical protein [Streptomyces sulphureus]